MSLSRPFTEKALTDNRKLVSSSIYFQTLFHEERDFFQNNVVTIPLSRLVKLKDRSRLRYKQDKIEVKFRSDNSKNPHSMLAEYGIAVQFDRSVGENDSPRTVMWDFRRPRICLLLHRILIDQDFVKNQPIDYDICGALSDMFPDRLLLTQTANSEKLHGLRWNDGACYTSENGNMKIVQPSIRWKFFESIEARVLELLFDQKLILHLKFEDEDYFRLATFVEDDLVGYTNQKIIPKIYANFWGKNVPIFSSNFLFSQFQTTCCICGINTQTIVTKGVYLINPKAVQERKCSRCQGLKKIFNHIKFSSIGNNRSIHFILIIENTIL